MPHIEAPALEGHLPTAALTLKPGLPNAEAELGGADRVDNHDSGDDHST